MQWQTYTDRCDRQTHTYRQIDNRRRQIDKRNQQTNRRKWIDRHKQTQIDKSQMQRHIDTTTYGYKVQNKITKKEGLGTGTTVNRMIVAAGLIWH